MSLRSSELMVWKEVSDPECIGVGVMVDNEEEEGSAEWHGVGALLGLASEKVRFEVPTVLEEPNCLTTTYSHLSLPTGS